MARTLLLSISMRSWCMEYWCARYSSIHAGSSASAPVRLLLRDVDGVEVMGVSVVSASENDASTSADWAEVELAEGKSSDG
jgi:hypothetical protein